MPKKTYPTIGCCGLDCGLCPRYYTMGTSRCPGCAGPNFFNKHPSCSFITCCVKKKNFEVCAELLDKHPNLYIDLSMDGGIARYHKYLKQDLDKIKDFVLAYQDRILFGSDIILGLSETKDFNWLYDRIRCDIDLHEKVEYTCEFGETDWVHEGFNLDKEVLKKLYYENPKKVLGF